MLYGVFVNWVWVFGSMFVALGTEDSVVGEVIFWKCWISYADSWCYVFGSCWLRQRNRIVLCVSVCGCIGFSSCSLVVGLVMWFIRLFGCLLTDFCCRRLDAFDSVVGDVDCLLLRFEILLFVLKLIHATLVICCGGMLWRKKSSSSFASGSG